MIKPCKFCGRSGWIVKNSPDGKINKEKCVNCNGKGFIFMNEKKEVNKNGVLDKETTSSPTSSSSS